MVSLLDLAKRYEEMADEREATAHRFTAVHEETSRSFMEEAQLLRELAANLQKRFEDADRPASDD